MVVRNKTDDSYDLFCGLVRTSVNVAKAGLQIITKLKNLLTR